MNSSTFVNKLELQVYSTLISIMSGINRLKTPPRPLASYQDQQNSISEASLALMQPHKKTISVSWDVIQQAALSLLLWVILGFAAGFLIGMIRPG